MKKVGRRHFLQNVVGLVGLAVSADSFKLPKRKPLLSFSTLGCPDWSFEKIVAFAVGHGYDGLEIRTIQRELDLPKCAEFKSPEKIAETSRFVKDNGIKIVSLGASASLHHRPGAERKKNLDEAKRFIDLADKLKCPYIRVFPNDFPAGQEHKETMDLIANGLLELGDYAKHSGVMVLMESHGQVVKSADLLAIMQAAEHTHVGLVWDIVNMWVVTKEPPAEVYDVLKNYVRHAHIKDLNLVDGKEQYVLLGKGQAPVFEGIDALLDGGFKGYYSFEWEKLWHPEIADPEIALADFPVAFRGNLESRKRHTGKT